MSDIQPSDSLLGAALPSILLTIDWAGAVLRLIAASVSACWLWPTR